jgi:hypothetical protein
MPTTMAVTVPDPVDAVIAEAVTFVVAVDMPVTVALFVGLLKA